MAAEINLKQEVSRLQLASDVGDVFTEAKRYSTDSKYGKGLEGREREDVKLWRQSTKLQRPGSLHSCSEQSA